MKCHPTAKIGRMPQPRLAGWVVHWYDAKKVFDAASEALRIDDLDAHFLQLRRSIGPPWGKDHKIAMAAAIVAAREIIPSQPSRHTFVADGA